MLAVWWSSGVYSLSLKLQPPFVYIPVSPSPLKPAAWSLNLLPHCVTLLAANKAMIDLGVRLKSSLTVLKLVCISLAHLNHWLNIFIIFSKCMFSWLSFLWCNSTDDKDGFSLHLFCLQGIMGSEVDILKQSLKSLLGQLHFELSILERIVHKNKNQHRRCKYFQYLLKVSASFWVLCFFFCLLVCCFFSFFYKHVPFENSIWSRFRGSSRTVFRFIYFTLFQILRWGGILGFYNLLSWRNYWILAFKLSVEVSLNKKSTF